MEKIAGYHPDATAFDPGGGNSIHAAKMRVFLSISSFGTKRSLCGSWFMDLWGRLFLPCVSFTSGFIPSEKTNHFCRLASG